MPNIRVGSGVNVESEIGFTPTNTQLKQFLAQDVPAIVSPLLGSPNTVEANGTKPRLEEHERLNGPLGEN
jgi:hypothetical protein